jgi:hypothetical protein
MATVSEKNKDQLQSILDESTLSSESVLYRFTSEKYLIKKDEQEFLKANKEPHEMVVDHYTGPGHVFMAKDIGPGLSFLTEPLDEYERDDRICVKVKLKDLLHQGGLMYQVTSLPAYITAYFFTLPIGPVGIERLSS